MQKTSKKSVNGDSRSTAKPSSRNQLDADVSARTALTTIRHCLPDMNSTHGKRDTGHDGKKNRDFWALVWISVCISTGWDVGKLLLCPQANFYPKQVLSRYNVYARTFLCAKSLICIRYTDLSTKKHAFTITTIFMYTSLFKTQRQTRTVEKSPKQLFSPCKPSGNSKNL